MFIVSCFIGVYYNVVISWTLFYLGVSFNIDVPWSECDNHWNTPGKYYPDFRGCKCLLDIYRTNGRVRVLVKYLFVDYNAGLTLVFIEIHGIFHMSLCSTCPLPYHR